ncbi:MAG: cation diffusion facilitator family transporter [Proteobacteria bacterium]|nr:cation diffusion facilitator family transporter [Pseudomonadota bacterium]
MKEDHIHQIEHARSSSSHQHSLFIALFITGAIMVAEVIGGLLSNSLALLSDAGHMLMDILALLLSLLALRFATRPATEKQTFGFYRLEILAALVNGTVLLALSLFIFYEAYQRIVEPQEIRGLLMLGVAAIGLGANIVSALVLRAGSHENLNVKGAFLHVVGDLLSSVGVVLGGVIILLTGWKVVDSILSFVIGGIILIGAYKLVMESVHILLESTPKHIGLKEVVDGVKTIEGVRDLHHVHIWTITSGIYALSAHVLIEDQMTSRSSQILEEINRFLRERFNIDHTTIQFECEACEMDFVCRLDITGNLSESHTGK